MHRLLHKLINHLVEKPKTLFLIDSLGATLTAFILFVIMRQHNEFIGMPKIVLTYLSLIALSFGMYSAACFLFLKKHWALFITLIGIANLLYCALTVTLLLNHYSLLTMNGTIYFVMEIVIICGLSYVELKVAREIQK